MLAGWAKGSGATRGTASVSSLEPRHRAARQGDAIVATRNRSRLWKDRHAVAETRAREAGFRADLSHAGGHAASIARREVAPVRPDRRSDLGGLVLRLRVRRRLPGELCLGQA